ARTGASRGALALSHDRGGLAAGREMEDLRLIVLDNAGGGIFHSLPQAEAMPKDEFEALLGTPAGLEPAAAAELFGLSVATPSNPAELDDALSGDARTIVVRTDRRRNLELHQELAEAAAATLTSTSSP